MPLSFSKKLPVFTQSDLLISTKALDTFFLFMIACELYNMVGVQFGKGFYERGGAVTMKMNGTYEGCHMVKSRRVRRRLKESVSNVS